MSEATTPAPAPADTAAAAVATDTAPTPAPAPASWRESLPPELREAPSLGKYQDVASLAKGYVEAQTLIGRKGAIIPKEGDSPEVTAAFRQAMGVPEKPEGYEIKVPEGLPAGVWNDDAAGQFRTWAHELGLTPTQAQGLAERYAQMGGNAVQQSAEVTETELRKEWGVAFNAKMKAANDALRNIGGEDLAQYLQTSGLGNHPAMVRAWAKIGEGMGEDRPAGMGTGRSSGMMTPSEAKAERMKIMGDKNSAYWNRRDPAHRMTVDRVTDLMRMEGAQ